MSCYEIWYLYAKEVASKHLKFEEKTKGNEEIMLSTQEKDKRLDELKLSFTNTVPITNSYIDLIVHAHELEIIFVPNKNLIKKFHCAYIKQRNNNKESILYTSNNGYNKLFHLSTWDILELEFKIDRQIEIFNKKEKERQEDSELCLQAQSEKEKESNKNKAMTSPQYVHQNVKNKVVQHKKPSRASNKKRQFLKLKFEMEKTCQKNNQPMPSLSLREFKNKKCNSKGRRQRKKQNKNACKYSLITQEVPNQSQHIPYDPANPAYDA